MSRWLRHAADGGGGGFDVAVDPAEAGWTHSGLHVLSLGPGESRSVETGDREWLVLPLSGSVTVESEDVSVELTGRDGVFDGPTDFAYVPIGSTMTIGAIHGAQVALPHAGAARRHPFRRVAASRLPAELRGAGASSRQVRSIAMADLDEVDSLLVCEVLTPAGNWSSWPPHKHDEDLPGRETELEEIYYFRLRAVAGAPCGANPVGYHRVYGTTARPIDVLAEVGDGDVVLVPHGWHGPSIAAPGYDMYYLNVMAGPKREWLISDDPAHGWVRNTWAIQAGEDPPGSWRHRL